MNPTPRSIRWEALTKKQFDAIDRERAVVFVTCSPMEVPAQRPLRGQIPAPGARFCTD